MSQIYEKKSKANKTGHNFDLSAGNVSTGQTKKTNNLKSVSGTGTEYQKTYYCRNSSQLLLIRSRNSLQNDYLPSFQIVLESTDSVTVKMKRYPFSGLQQVIRSWAKPPILRKHIVGICKAIQILQNRYGKLHLTQQKIKADSKGNIVLWVSEDFQQFFPDHKLKYLPRHTKNQISSNERYGECLETIRSLLARAIQRNKLNIDLSELNNMPFKQSSSNYKLTNNNRKQTIKVQNQSRTTTPSLNAKGLKKLVKSDLLTFHSQNINSQKEIEKSERINTQKSKKFSFTQSPFRSNLKACRSTQFFKPRMSKYEIADSRLNNSNIYACQTNKKVPRFIKQRQKTKDQSIFDIVFQKMPVKNSVCKKGESKNQEDVSYNQTIPIYNMKQQAIIQIDSAQHANICETFSSDQRQQYGFNFEDSKSCALMMRGEDIQNESPTQTIQALRQCLSTNNFFLSNLSQKQQNQLKEDLQKIFFRGHTNIQDKYEEFEGQELKRQLMLLIE